MIETNCIPLEQLSSKNDNDFEIINKGGIFLITKDHEVSIGCIINDFGITNDIQLEYYGYNKSIKKYFAIIKEYKNEYYEQKFVKKTIMFQNNYMN